MYLQLILMLTVTAAAGQHPSYSTVRAGDEVHLPCKEVTDGQNNCDKTTWSFISSTSVMLFEDGLIQHSVNISDRLNVTDNCSLVIKKVLIKDVGQYTCRQSTSGQQGPNSSVYLSVVHMTEQKINDSVVLSCSVLDYNFHRHTVEWLYEGKGETSSHIDSSLPIHRSTVLLTTPLHQNSTFFSSITCNVTNISTKQVQLFTFSHQSPPQNAGWPWWHVVVFVASTGALIIVLLFIKWKKSKGNKIKKEENTQEPILEPEVTVLGPETSEDMADPEGGVCYASVCHTSKTKGKTQVHYSVAYSTVNISSPEATTDQDVVYTTVKQKNTDVTQ